MKRKTIIVSMAIGFLLGASTMLTVCAKHTYPKTMVVSNVDYGADVVTIKTFSGIEYQFDGCEDWYEGDICSTIMFTNWTSGTVYDDKIIETRYSGWITEWEGK